MSDTPRGSAARREALLTAKGAVLQAWSAFHHLDIPERETLAAAAVLAIKSTGLLRMGGDDD